MKQSICGKRSEYSYLNATRAEMNDDKTWSCPDGTIACSQNTTLGGSTVCASDRNECPVTDLLLLDLNSPKLDDLNGYTVRKSNRGVFKHTQLNLAFTSNTNARSNAPLNHIYWDVGYKCQFVD